MSSWRSLIYAAIWPAGGKQRPWKPWVRAHKGIHESMGMGTARPPATRTGMPTSWAADLSPNLSSMVIGRLKTSALSGACPWMRNCAAILIHGADSLIHGRFFPSMRALSSSMVHSPLSASMGALIRVRTRASTRAWHHAGSPGACQAGAVRRRFPSAVRRTRSPGSTLSQSLQVTGLCFWSRPSQ